MTHRFDRRFESRLCFVDAQRDARRHLRTAYPFLPRQRFVRALLLNVQLTRATFIEILFFASHLSHGRAMKWFDGEQRRFTMWSCCVLVLLPVVL